MHLLHTEINGIEEFLDEILLLMYLRAIFNFSRQLTDINSLHIEVILTYDEYLKRFPRNQDVVPLVNHVPSQYWLDAV